ncbi:hypothetical protein HGRIS_004685 [Hohenbuehelia grisea]|uniref:Uncharacterized protein n=1 Tax=Hohenbuehelia grisea TaxID=104357 RepID=A0ABR3JD25_9AGAR
MKILVKRAPLYLQVATLVYSSEALDIQMWSLNDRQQSHQRLIRIRPTHYQPHPPHKKMWSTSGLLSFLRESIRHQAPVNTADQTFICTYPRCRQFRLSPQSLKALPQSNCKV